jgi:serine/threonine protein kinase/beta-lactam-binding protein with PASTA domain
LSENQRVIAGRYELGQLIGRGGMADVYEGIDTRLGRTVAIKLLKSDLANDPNFEARFRQEAQASARMAHPTIVRVYDAGEDITADAHGNELKHPFIVMEFVKGKLLRDLMHERRLTRQEVIDYASGVLTALEFSHRAGVVHRDIKSANIMITETGAVKVMDFGIARAVSDSSATMAHTSGIMGTAQYFSPEQAKGESVDARTDLYSSGVLIYEMLTGRPPFKGETAVSVAYQHVSEAVPVPSQFDASISPELDQVVLHSLAKDRNERFQTAEEFREHLVAAANGSPFTAPTTVVEAPVEVVSVVEPEAVAEVQPENDLEAIFGTNLAAEAPIEEPAAEPTPLPEVVEDDFEALLAEASRDATSVMPQAYVAPEKPAAPVSAPIATPASNPTEVFSEPITNPFATLGVELPADTGSNASAAQTFAKSGKPSPRLLWGGGSAAAVILVGLIVWLFTLGSFNLNVNPGGSGIEVANVVNSTYQDGYVTITQQGLLVSKVYEASETVPADTIIRTDPTAGTKVPEKTVITVYVSSGKNTVALPNLAGMTEAEAATALATAKLTLGTITQAASPNVEAGKVISTDPVFNSQVAEGTVVNLIISNGKVNVPDVRNLSISEARNIMSSVEVGFTVSITTKDVCSGTTGTIVTDQSILPGLADQRSAIVLYVGCNQ